MTNVLNFVNINLIMPKIRKNDNLVNKQNENADTNSAEILKRAISPAVVSDQINLFENEEPLQLYTKPKNKSEIKPEDVNFEQITLDNLAETDNLEENSKVAAVKEPEEKEKKKKGFKFFKFNKPPKTIIEISSTPEEETEKLEEVEETVKKQSSKKKKWLSFLFLLINIGVVAGILIYQLKSDTEMTSFGELLSSGINWWIFLFAIFLFFLNMLTEGGRFWILTWKTTSKSRPALSYKTAALGRYYDNITPLSSGGEPFQVFYMNKHGIDAGKAVSIPIGKYIFFQIAYVCLSLIVMIFSISYARQNIGTTIVTAASWIGFALNLALVCVVLIVSISKKVGDKIITGLLKLLKKMHLIKNYEKTLNKSLKVIGEYQKAVTEYAKSKWTFIVMLILSFAGLIINYSTPYIIYSMFNGFDPSIYWELFIKVMMVDLAASFIPLPGGTGVAEISFTALFSSLMGSNIFWAMLLWRILTYYSYILQGLIITIYDYARGNKKQEWLDKKWKLEEESRQFEEAQMKDFELMLSKQNKKKKKKEK